QIVLAGALDQDCGELADPGAALEAYYAVDLRRVGAGAAETRLIDENFHGPAYFRLQSGGTDRRLRLHQPAAPFLSHLARNGVRQSVGCSSLHRRVSKAADAIQLGFLQKFQQFRKLRFGFAREAGDEGAADRDLRTDLPPAADARQHVFGARRPLHQLENARARVLERHVEVRQELALRHQRNRFVDVRVRVDVMQPHPDSQLAQGATKTDEA